jgi:hypothetical protein
MFFSKPYVLYFLHLRDFSCDIFKKCVLHATDQIFTVEFDQQKLFGSHTDSNLTHFDKIKN